MKTRMKSLPVVSVVIAAYNEEKRIQQTLTALKKQTYTPPFELLVVDNASTDQTATIAKRMGATVLYESQKGVSFAMNTGVKNAHGSIILMTDADTIVPPNWIENYVRYFRLHKTSVAASGPFEYIDGPTSVKTFTHMVAHHFPNIMLVTTVGMNMGFRKKIYDRVCGFSTAFQLQTDSHFGNACRKIGPIGFLQATIVKSSGRRFKSIGHLIGLAIFRWCNFQYMKLFSRPLASQFRDIR